MKGELQNGVILRNCEVRDAESKTNRARKFEVVVRGKKSNYLMLLKLECKEPRQRDDWFNLMMKEIALAKKDYDETASNLCKPPEEDFEQWIAMNDVFQLSQDCTTPMSENQDTFEFQRDENSYSNAEEEEEAVPIHRGY